MSMRRWAPAAIILLALALLVSGCGGGSSTSRNYGSAVGRVEYMNTSVGLGGVTVALTGNAGVFSGVSSASGDFSIQNVPAGLYSVTVTAPEGTGWVLPPGDDLPSVRVYADDTTNIGTIVMMDEGDQPPGPPGS